MADDEEYPGEFEWVEAHMKAWQEEIDAGRARVDDPEEFTIRRQELSLEYRERQDYEAALDQMVAVIQRQAYSHEMRSALDRLCRAALKLPIHIDEDDE